ncbi:MAG: hypothetical protein EBZ78_13665 [Verrucomicrobia bacterium]|nr:hypothetical protein [Verrucomicrobiota bacterium]
MAALLLIQEATLVGTQEELQVIQQVAVAAEDREMDKVAPDLQEPVLVVGLEAVHNIILDQMDIILL